jgi:hypothetical protein
VFTWNRGSFGALGYRQCCKSTTGIAVSTGLIIAVVSAIAWAIPLVAIFAAVALPAGALVGFALILSRKGLDEILIVFRREPAIGDNTQISRTTEPDIPFSQTERFRALFELRYHPICGQYPEKVLRKQLFTEIWSEVETGIVDGSALRDRVMKLDMLRLEQRRELLNDVMELVEAAKK